MWDIFTFGFIFKVAYETLATPLTYAVVGFLKRAEQEDYYDVGTDFNPFHLTIPPLQASTGEGQRGGERDGLRWRTHALTRNGPPRRGARGLAGVAAEATHVRIDATRIPAYVATLSLETIPAAEYDLQHHFRGTAEETAAFVLTLNAINFGSGYFPHLRKPPGLSGYFTITGALTRAFSGARPAVPQRNSPPSARTIAGAIFGQVPDDALRRTDGALRHVADGLGQHLAAHYEAGATPHQSRRRTVRPRASSRCSPRCPRSPRRGDLPGPRRPPSTSGRGSPSPTSSSPSTARGSARSAISTG